MSAASAIAPRLLALAGFTAMAFAGWKFAGETPATLTAVQDSTPAGKTGARTDRPLRDTGPPAEVRQKLAALRAIADPAERTQAAIDLANSLSFEELAEWFGKKWSDSVPGFDRTIFRKVAMQRWRGADPEGHLRWAMKADSYEAGPTVTQWAKSDFERALAVIRENDNGNKGWLEINALAAIADQDPSKALGHLGEMLADPAHKRTNDYQIGDFLRKLADRSPAALAAAIAGLKPPLLERAEVALATHGLKTDFAAEIRKLQGRADGLEMLGKALDRLTGSKLDGDQVLAAISTMPPEWRASLAKNPSRFIPSEDSEKWFAADLAGAGFSADEAKSIRIRALQTIGYSKPEAALRMLDQLDLDPEQRMQNVTNLFRYSREGKNSEDLLALLTNDEDRETARAAIAKVRESESLATTTPTEWLTKVAGNEESRNSIYPFLNAIRSWDKARIGELTAQFRELPADQKQATALQVAGVSSGDDLEFRSEAIRYLVENPPPKDPKQPHRSPDPERTAVKHAVHWALKDPEAACQWVQTLPDGNTKLWAQKNVAKNWAQYDPDAARQWIGSLPAETRGQVEAFMKEPQKW